MIQFTTRVERMAVFVKQIDGDFRVEHTTNPLDEKGFYLNADHPLVTFFKKHDRYISLREFMRTTLYRSLWEKEKQLFSAMHVDCFVPLISDNELVGIVFLPEKKDRVPYLDSDLKNAQDIADICAPALKDACIYERAIDEARIDKLTGLINRKFFLELLDREFEQYKDTEYGTFKMANNMAFNKLNAPDLGMIVAGAIISAIGMLVGSLWNKKRHNQKNK